VFVCEREREREGELLFCLPFADRGLFVGTAPQGETKELCRVYLVPHFEETRCYYKV